MTIATYPPSPTEIDPEQVTFVLMDDTALPGHALEARFNDDAEHTNESVKPRPDRLLPIPERVATLLNSFTNGYGEIDRSEIRIAVDGYQLGGLVRLQFTFPEQFTVKYGIDVAGDERFDGHQFNGVEPETLPRDLVKSYTPHFPLTFTGPTTNGNYVLEARNASHTIDAIERSDKHVDCYYDGELVATIDVSSRRIAEQFNTEVVDVLADLPHPSDD